jgi:hypothetical protein
MGEGGQRFNRPGEIAEYLRMPLYSADEAVAIRYVWLTVNLSGMAGS